MPSELLFHVSGSAAVRADPVTLAEVSLKERVYLQEWVLQHPQMLDEGVHILRFEFDQWNTKHGEQPGDRLDVLGLGDDGRLVVAQLKRDVAPETI